MAAGVTAIHLPWYATLFRGDKFETALLEIAPLALRYGATEWTIYRSADDTYKFLQIAVMSKEDFEVYWYGKDFCDWRADYSSWYQVPIVYAPQYVVGTGRLEAAAAMEHKVSPTH